MKTVVLLTPEEVDAAAQRSVTSTGGLGPRRRPGAGRLQRRWAGEQVADLGQQPASSDGAGVSASPSRARRAASACIGTTTTK